MPWVGLWERFGYCFRLTTLAFDLMLFIFNKMWPDLSLSCNCLWCRFAVMCLKCICTSFTTQCMTCASMHFVDLVCQCCIFTHRFVSWRYQIVTNSFMFTAKVFIMLHGSLLVLKHHCVMSQCIVSYADKFSWIVLIMMINTSLLTLDD